MTYKEYCMNKALKWSLAGALTFEDIRRIEKSLDDYKLLYDGRKESNMITDYEDIKTNGDKAYLTDYKTADNVRKEERMSDKYVVSQEFMNVLEEWKENLATYDEPGLFIDGECIEDLPYVVNAWWGDDVPDEENNNRLIAIIRWVNGEDVFEVEKPKKWVVRSKVKNEFGYFGYVSLSTFNIAHNSFDIALATEFDTKEEAESWANSHQEVIEVEV